MHLHPKQLLWSFVLSNNFGYSSVTLSTNCRPTLTHLSWHFFFLAFIGGPHSSSAQNCCTSFVISDWQQPRTCLEQHCLSDRSRGLLLTLCTVHTLSSFISTLVCSCAHTFVRCRTGMQLAVQLALVMNVTGTCWNPPFIYFFSVLQDCFCLLAYSSHAG